MLQRIVAEVVAERPLRTTQMRRHGAVDGKFGFRRNPVPSIGILRHRQLAAQNERSDHQLRQMLRHWSDSSSDQRRRSAEEYADGQLFIAQFRLMVMEASALMNLPVHAGRGSSKYLHPVHTEIMLLGMERMLRIYERQCNKRTAVILPAGQERQPFKRLLPANGLHDRRGDVGNFLMPTL